MTELLTIEARAHCGACGSEKVMFRLKAGRLVCSVCSATLEQAKAAEERRAAEKNFCQHAIFCVACADATLGKVGPLCEKGEAIRHGATK